MPVCNNIYIYFFVFVIIYSLLVYTHCRQLSSIGISASLALRTIQVFEVDIYRSIPNHHQQLLRLPVYPSHLSTHTSIIITVSGSFRHFVLSGFLINNIQYGGKLDQHAKSNQSNQSFPSQWSTCIYM